MVKIDEFGAAAFWAGSGAVAVAASDLFAPNRSWWIPITFGSAVLVIGIARLLWVRRP